MIVETADRLRKSVGRFSSFNDVKIGQHAIGPHQEARSHHPRCFDPTDAVAEVAKPAQEATIIDEPRLTRHQGLKSRLLWRLLCEIVLLPRVYIVNPQRTANLLYRLITRPFGAYQRD